MRGASARPWKLALPALEVSNRPGCKQLRLATLAAFLCVLAAGSSFAADRIILRNLELIADRTVIAVDEDGIQLDEPRTGGTDRLTWDEIERGRVSTDLQAEFNQLQGELGPPLFKLRQRLRIGDYAGLLAPAADLYPRFAQRQSQTAYLVCQSLMWGRLAAGEREGAVEPFLRCVALLASGAADARGLPGARRLLVEASTPLCGDLPPVWLDRQAAKDLLPAVQTLIKEMPMPRPPEVYLYYASLASAAGEADEASKVLRAVESSSASVTQVAALIRAQIEIERGRPASAAAALPSLAAESPLIASLAAFWHGRGLLASKDIDSKRDGLLSLLSIPANDKGEQAELAAAALEHSAAALAELKDAAGAAAVRRELQARFGATAVGVQTLGKKL